MGWFGRAGQHVGFNPDSKDGREREGDWSDWCQMTIVRVCAGKLWSSGKFTVLQEFVRPNRKTTDGSKMGQDVVVIGLDIAIPNGEREWVGFRTRNTIRSVLLFGKNTDFSDVIRRYR